MKRNYDNSNRSKRSAETAKRILEIAEVFIRAQPIDNMTLNAVAHEAGVTIQTVLRHFGSRDGLLEAVARCVGERVSHQRTSVEPGDVEIAVDNVLEHYEAEGDLIVNLLLQESTNAFAAQAASRGRAYHREWVLQVFGPLMSSKDDVTIDALVVATDLYVWRLLRRDLRRELQEVREVMLKTIYGILGQG